MKIIKTKWLTALLTGSLALGVAPAHAYDWKSVVKVATGLVAGSALTYGIAMLIKKWKGVATNEHQSVATMQEKKAFKAHVQKQKIAERKQVNAIVAKYAQEIEQEKIAQEVEAFTQQFVKKFFPKPLAKQVPAATKYLEVFIKRSNLTLELFINCLIKQQDQHADIVLTWVNYLRHDLDEALAK